MSDAPTSGGLGAALFFGLSLFVAVTQGEPEIVYADPGETHDLPVITAGVSPHPIAIPSALARPVAVETDRGYATLGAPENAALETAPRVTTQAQDRPAALSPALAKAPPAQSAPGRLTALQPLTRAALHAMPRTQGPQTTPNTNDVVSAPRPAGSTMAVSRTQRLATTSAPAPLVPMVAITRPAVAQLAALDPDLSLPRREQARTGQVNASRVFLRATPDLDGEILGQFDAGIRLYVIGPWQRWQRVRVLDSDPPLLGWMWRTYVDLD